MLYLFFHLFCKRNFCWRRQIKFKRNRNKMMINLNEFVCFVLLCFPILLTNFGVRYFIDLFFFFIIFIFCHVEIFIVHRIKSNETVIHQKKLFSFVFCQKYTWQTKSQTLNIYFKLVHSSICMLSCANKIARRDSNSDSLSAWSSAFLTDGESMWW